MISSQLLNQITQQLHKKTGVANWEIVDPIIEARECTVYKLSSAKYPDSIAIKVYRNVQKNNFILQHDVLEKLSRLLTQPLWTESP